MALAILAVPVSFILWIFAVAIWYSFIPLSKTEVPIPQSDAVITVEQWMTISDARYELEVRTPRGHARAELFEDWGPAQRTNLYVTPEGMIVAIGGGNVLGFSNPRSGPPAILPNRSVTQSDGTDWRYVGAVDQHEPRFFSPGQKRECIALFGANSMRFRKAFQAEHFCD